MVQRSDSHDDAPDAIIAMDRTDRILEFNRAAETTFGYRRDDVIGRDMAECIIPARLRRHHRRGLARCLETGDSTILEKRLETTAMRAGGEEFPVELTVVPDSTTAGLGFLGFVRDITDRKRAEAVGERNERRFRALVENAYDGIVLTDADRNVVYVGPSITRILGYSPEEVIGHPVFAFYHPDDAERLAGLSARQRLEPESRIAAQFRVRDKDGSWRWIDAVATNLLADPDVRAVVGNFRDITEEKEAEEARARLAAIVDSTEAAIFSGALDGAIETWNAGAEKEEILGRIKRGAPVDQFLTVRLRKDGTPIHVPLTVSPVRDASGAIVAASTVARDITERVRLSEQTEGRLRQLQALRDIDAAIRGSLDVRVTLNILLELVDDHEVVPRAQLFRPIITRSRESAPPCCART